MREHWITLTADPPALKGWTAVSNLLRSIPAHTDSDRRDVAMASAAKGIRTSHEVSRDAKLATERRIDKLAKLNKSLLMAA